MNILWLTIDSMRTYPSNSDDRGLIPFFYEFAENAMVFDRCYCSAPSTVMSVSSMMTAVPSVYHSTSYDHFDKNSLGFDTFPNWLNSRGIKPHSVLFFPEGREHLTHLVGNTLREYWPKGKNGNFWSNEEIFNVYSRALDDCDGESENFFYVHLNIRHDPKTDGWVRKCYRQFKQKFPDSIVLMTSDHGYPDAERGIQQQEMIYHGHDLLMTEDNVRVPLAIEFPEQYNLNGSYDGLASLVDVAPTLQRLIDNKEIETLNSQFHDAGIDLFSEKRKNAEIYNRYIFQKDQQIKFISENRKIIISDEEVLCEEGNAVSAYTLTPTENAYIEAKKHAIDDHFKGFLSRKLKNLQQGSVIFCSTPPPNISRYFEDDNDAKISFTSDIGEVQPYSTVYVLKASQNIFQTIADYRLAKAQVKNVQRIGVLSLNLDPVAFRDSRLAAVADLFFTRFLPRFIYNPIHTSRELWVLLKKLMKNR